MEDEARNRIEGILPQNEAPTPFDMKGHATDQPAHWLRFWERDVPKHSGKALFASILLFVLTPTFLVMNTFIPFREGSSPLPLYTLTAYAFTCLTVLMVTASVLLLIWQLRRMLILGTIFAASGIGLSLFHLWVFPQDSAALFWLGIGVAGGVAYMRSLRQRGIHIRLVLWGLLALPLIASFGIWMTEHRGFIVAHVSTTTPLKGEEMSVTVTGLFGIPAGHVVVYLFPVLEGPVRAGTEPPYFMAEGDRRHTVSVRNILFPRLFHTSTFVAGETDWECRGGDICSSAHPPIEGTYQVGVAVQKLFSSRHTLLIAGPVIEITVSDTQRESMNLRDETEFLYAALCDVIRSYHKHNWAFMREYHACGGFSGARAGTDPDLPVWNEKREEADTRPPMSIEGDMLCLNDVAQAPYTGHAKVCMPYAGDPQAPLPEPDTIDLSLDWGGSEHWIFENEAIGTFEDIARDEGKKRFSAFDMPNYSGNLDLQDQGDGYHTYRFKRLDSYAQRKYGGQPSTGKWVSSVLATLGPDHRLCLFYELVGQTSLPDDHFTDPTHWEGCTVIVDPPQGKNASK